MHLHERILVAMPFILIGLVLILSGIAVYYEKHP